MTLLSSDRRMVPRDMPRPTGVTVVGCVFLGAGVYLSSIAMIVLVAPKALSTLRALPFLYLIKLMKPYAPLVIGLIWTVVAWGLWQLRNWARFTPTRLLGIGVASALPIVVLHGHDSTMADARLRPRHYLESLDYFVPHETVYPGRIPN